jgi:hypothetical protein
MSGAEFISEDDLDTFEGWSRYQAFGETTSSAQARALWDKANANLETFAPVGRMKLPPLSSGELRYAVALEEEEKLWLAMWIRRSVKGDIYVFYPRRDGQWNPHTSYHANGRFHMKSYDQTVGRVEQRQPPSSAFRGIEFLGEYTGHGPKRVGAICDSADFTDVIRVPSGVLGPRHGVVSVQLLEPGLEPPRAQAHPLFASRVFRDLVPWLAVSVYDTARR